MDLDSLGNLGELIGGIAVVVSLVYLAVQIRHGAALVKAADGKLIRRGEPAPGVAFAYVEDPDGYVLEL